MNTKYDNLPFSLSNLTMLKLQLWQLSTYCRNLFIAIDLKNPACNEDTKQICKDLNTHNT